MDVERVAIAMEDGGWVGRWIATPGGGGEQWVWVAIDGLSTRLTMC